MRRPLVAVVVTLAAVVSSAAVTSAAGATASPRPKPSAGCNQSTVTPGEEQVTIQSGGVERFYFRHVPPGYDGTNPMPLVIDFHGYIEPAAIHVIHSKLGPYGDEHGFITLTPSGTGQPVHWEVGLHSADVRFVAQLLDEAETTLCVDTRRIYAAGLSNGAIFSSILACSLSDRIAAIAPVSGVRDFKRCAPDRPVPVVAFHGTDDKVLSFDGGLGPVGLNLPTSNGQTLGQVRPDLAKGKSIPDTVAAWAKRNGCKKTPTEKRVADDVKLVRYSGCDANATVELYEIIGGGHTWPGSEFSRAIESTVGHVTFSIDADQVMWDFFQAHPLRG